MLTLSAPDPWSNEEGDAWEVIGPGISNWNERALLVMVGCWSFILEPGRGRKPASWWEGGPEGLEQKKKIKVDK